MARPLLVAGTATGAPDKTVPLSAASPEFAWDGEQGMFTNAEYSEETCNREADTHCELILLDLRSDTPVVLDASLTQFSNPLADFDLRIYKSNPERSATSGSRWSTPRRRSSPGRPWLLPKGSKTLRLKARKLKAGGYQLVSSGDVNGQHRVQTQAVKLKK